MPLELADMTKFTVIEIVGQHMGVNQFESNLLYYKQTDLHQVWAKAVFWEHASWAKW
jgi:hypothetical protein